MPRTSARCSTRRLNNVTKDEIKRVGLIAACLGLALSCGACSSIGPAPWEKDLMARKEMQPNAYQQQIAAEEHIYFSKEASSGGRGFAGGGCGCN